MHGIDGQPAHGIHEDGERKIPPSRGVFGNPAPEGITTSERWWSAD
jgi:hypothetical protein